MFHVDNNSGVANMPALAPAQSNTTTWFTEGDGQKGISWIGQDWLNILQAELLNILAEASIQPDKAQLNQLTLSIKAIIAANAFSRKNNLKEIADAGAEAQRLARGYLGLGALATKNSLGPGDVNALAKDQNLADLENAGTARNNLDVYSKSEGDNRYLRREQNGADIPDKGAFIDNVGLGEAAKRDVGTGENQIPDMASFASGDGWMKLPNGKILQYGRGAVTPTLSTQTMRITFSIPFSKKADCAMLTHSGDGGAPLGAGRGFVMTAEGPTLTGFNSAYRTSSTSDTVSMNYSWWAVGE
ncbi:hypothetical protein GHS85_RS14300 [Escherichia coli]|nr:hypothetical protein [Escherichia coli]EKH42608.1 putative tail fiber domain protein [Escherichia coli FRIK1999]